jgi:hypothetical protein
VPALLRRDELDAEEVRCACAGEKAAPHRDAGYSGDVVEPGPKLQRPLYSPLISPPEVYCYYLF